VRSTPDLDPGPDALRRISIGTITHYRSFAQAYRRGTWHHDVSQNVAALLDAIEGAPPYRILDLGCGPGRDLITFRNLGHQPIGLDGCPEFVDMARRLAIGEVWLQDMLALDLPAEQFDGVFANAVLFHVPSRALPAVLGDLWASLKPDGVLFSSNPRGDNEEGWADQRYACFYDLPTWRRLVEGAGFVLLDHYFRPPGKPNRQQPWLATLWRKRPVRPGG
jgi:SAM-dependent methyltransferase